MERSGQDKHTTGRCRCSFRRRRSRGFGVVYLGFLLLLVGGGGVMAEEATSRLLFSTLQANPPAIDPRYHPYRVRGFFPYQSHGPDLLYRQTLDAAEQDWVDPFSEYGPATPSGADWWSRVIENRRQRPDCLPGSGPSTPRLVGCAAVARFFRKATNRWPKLRWAATAVGVPGVVDKKTGAAAASTGYGLGVRFHWRPRQPSRLAVDLVPSRPLRVLGLPMERMQVAADLSREEERIKVAYRFNAFTSAYLTHGQDQNAAMLSFSKSF